MQRACLSLAFARTQRQRSTARGNADNLIWRTRRSKLPQYLCRHDWEILAEFVVALKDPGQARNDLLHFNAAPWPDVQADSKLRRGTHDSLPPSLRRTLERVSAHRGSEHRPQSPRSVITGDLLITPFVVRLPCCRYICDRARLNPERYAIANTEIGRLGDCAEGHVRLLRE